MRIVPRRRSIPHRTPEDRVEAIASLRRLRMTGAEIGAWAYGAIYGSTERTAALPGWLEFYNWRRPHRSPQQEAARNTPPRAEQRD